MLNLQYELFSTTDSGKLSGTLTKNKRLLTDVNHYRRFTNDLSTTLTKPTNGLLTDRLNWTNNVTDLQSTTIDGSKQTYDSTQTSLSANIIMAKLTNQFQRTRLMTSLLMKGKARNVWFTLVLFSYFHIFLTYYKE